MSRTRHWDTRLAARLNRECSHVLASLKCTPCRRPRRPTLKCVRCRHLMWIYTLCPMADAMVTRTSVPLKFFSHKKQPLIWLFFDDFASARFELTFGEILGQLFFSSVLLCIKENMSSRRLWIISRVMSLMPASLDIMAIGTLKVFPAEISFLL